MTKCPSCKVSVCTGLSHGICGKAAGSLIDACGRMRPSTVGSRSPRRPESSNVGTICVDEEARWTYSATCKFVLPVAFRHTAREEAGHDAHLLKHWHLRLQELVRSLLAQSRLDP